MCWLIASSCVHVPRPVETTETKPTEQQIDWTKPQPFPFEYPIPHGVKVCHVWTNGLCDIAPIDPTDHPLHPEFKGNYIAGTDPIPQPTKQ